MSTTHLISPPLNGPDSRPARARRDNHGSCSDVRPRRNWYLFVKPMLEYVIALILLIAAVPVILLAGLLVKLTSRGPAFYVQTRVGKHGRHFLLVKLRTMMTDAEAQTGPVWAGQDDPRVTPVGRLLRDTHIDEFPQLLNVVLGHMALIGPRPERPEFVEQLSAEIPHYTQRLNVKPGITGLAQLNLPADTDFSSVKRKLIHDLYYVRCLGPWLDLQIALGTGWVLFKTLLAFLWRSISLPSIERVNRHVEQSIIARDGVPTIQGAPK